MCGWRIFRNLSFLQNRFNLIFKETIIAFFLKICGVALTFFLNVLIARQFGANMTGVFFLSLTTASAASIFGCIGLENTFIRYTSASVAHNDWSSIKGMYRKGLQLSLPFSILLTILIVIFSRLIAEHFFYKPETAAIIRLMAMAILPTVLIYLHAELLKGIQRIAYYFLVHSIGVPALSILAFIVLCVQLDMGIKGVAWGHLIATSITATLGVGLWRLFTKNKMEGVVGDFHWQQLLRSSLPLFWVNLMNFIMMWSSMLFLGIWGTNDEVGIYATAYRTSMLTSFILIAVNTVAAPKYAEYYSCNQMKRLEETALTSLKMMFVLAVPPLVVFIIFPHWIMGFFGSDFMKGGMCLSILACGQFVNVATGSVGYILMMSGHEHLLRNAITLSAVSNLLLNLWLVPRYGIVGGAVATAVSLSMLNLVSAYYVWTQVKIKPLPLPFISSRY
jgi:O-antigen/teichoic acid export membrane protein